MMSSVFTSCVMRTRTLGNQSFCFQSIFTTTMNVNSPTPLTCSMMMDSNDQPVYVQYHLAPNFTSHIMRTRSAGKLRFFHFSSICSTMNEYHENKSPTSELHHLHLQPFFIIVITSSHTTLILAFENNGFKLKCQT